MDQKFKVMLARFPGGNSEHPAEVNFCINTTLACAFDTARVSQLEHWHLNDTPVTMSRNRCVKEAIARGVDILIMVDSDMGPDLIKPQASFWTRALDFIISRYHEAPTMIAAPYCGPPPHENVYVFRWRNYETGRQNPDYKLDQFKREEAAERSGIEAVAALPTGLIALDMRIFTGFQIGNKVVKLPPPWFYYEYTDEYETDKSSTEDVAFSRDVHLLFGAYGLETVFVDWDTWAVHFKTKGVAKPQLIDPGGLARLFKQRSEGIEARAALETPAPAAPASNGHNPIAQLEADAARLKKIMEAQVTNA